MNNFSSDYIAYCAGYPIGNFSPEHKKEIPEAEAKVMIAKLLAQGEDEDKIQLSVLRCAPDFQTMETKQERYYDGLDGPYYRTLILSAHAFGITWTRRSREIDRARDIRDVWYIQRKGEENAA